MVIYATVTCTAVDTFHNPRHVPVKGFIGLMCRWLSEDCSISSALAVEIPQSHTMQSIICGSTSKYIGWYRLNTAFFLIFPVGRTKEWILDERDIVTPNGVVFVTIGSHNSLSPVYELIIYTFAGQLSIGPMGTKFNEIWIKI